MKTDRFRLTNHSARSSSNIIIASQKSSLQCICFYEDGRISDHAINQSIYLFIYGTIKLQKQERWESENFDEKLHLRKQIKVQLRGMSMSINHNGISIDLLAEQPLPLTFLEQNSQTTH